VVVSHKAIKSQIRQCYSDREVLVTRLGEYRRCRNHVDAYLADSERKTRMLDDLDSMIDVVIHDIDHLDDTIRKLRGDPRVSTYRERIVQDVRPSGGFKVL
jgi:hypothetical protein